MVQKLIQAQNGTFNTLSNQKLWVFKNERESKQIPAAKQMGIT